MKHFLPKIVFTALLAFIVGIALTSFFPERAMLLFLLGATLAVIVVAASWNRMRAVLILTGGVFVFVGIWYAGLALEKVKTDTLLGKEVHANGTVLEDPKETEFSKRIIIRLHGCEDFDACAGVRIAAHADRFLDARYGQEVTLSCVLEKPEKFTEEFDWPMYLAGKKIYYQCSKADVKVIENARPTLLGVLGSIRAHLEENVNRAMSEPEAGLANGLLFGGDHRLSEKMSEKFSQTSMTHIVAVSGYNVSLLAGYAMWAGILLGLWRKQAMWLAFGAIIAFVLLIGFPASAIRAAVMGSVMLWALSSGRAGSGLRVLVFSGAAMLVWNPLLLKWDTGFQLSFLATAGIVALSSYMPRAFQEGKILGLRETFYITLIAQIFVLPIILATFNMFSITSVLVNVLVLWTIPIAMFFSFLAALVGFISSALAFVVALPAYALLLWTFLVVETFSKMQWSIMEVSSFSPWWIVVWYILLSAMLWWLWHREVCKARRLCKLFNNQKAAG